MSLWHVARSAYHHLLILCQGIQEYSDQLRLGLERQFQDSKHEAVCFFFHNYVNVPRESSVAFFLEAVNPLYTASAPDSALRFATEAVAVVITDFWRKGTINSQSANNLWLKAAAMTRTALSSPRSSHSDDILAAIFMLDFYDGLNSRYNKVSREKELHLEAGLALLQSRGYLNSQSDLGRRFVATFGARYIFSRLQSCEHVDVCRVLQEEDEISEWPIGRLHLIVAQMANVLADVIQVLDQSSDSAAYEHHGCHLATLLLRSCKVDQSLVLWLNTLPSSWHPHRINQIETLHPSIPAAGLYKNLCDVYSATTSGQMLNFYRILKITNLRIKRHLSLLLLQQNSPLPLTTSLPTLDAIDDQIQTLTDEICASVPFYLGGRLNPSFPHERHHYPPIPLDLKAATDYRDSMGRITTYSSDDHNRHANAAGGWLVLPPLMTLLEYSGYECVLTPPSQTTGFETDSTALRPNVLKPIRLRPGQMEWIEGQCKRIHGLHRMRWVPRVADDMQGSRGSVSMSASWGLRPDLERRREYKFEEMVECGCFLPQSVSTVEEGEFGSEQGYFAARSC